LPDTPKTPTEIHDRLIQLAAELTPVDLATIEPEPEPEKILPEPDRDPHRLAKMILARYTDPSGDQLLVSFQGDIYRYHDDHCHGALQNQPLVGASKPATILTGFGHVG
jgi:hypothetical protein